MSCGRFTWIDAGTVGPVDLSADDGMDDDGRRTRIVQIVKARGLFDFLITTSRASRAIRKSEISTSSSLTIRLEAVGKAVNGLVAIPELPV
jgi:hypothetical protein